MRYVTSKFFDRKLLKYARSDRRLFDLIRKQLKFFEQNEKHPSLRVHKLSGDLEGYWSLSINKSVRIIYFIKDNEAFFLNIGIHDEVYRMN